ncbi:unnamed protein product [Prunus brigantina]
MDIPDFTWFKVLLLVAKHSSEDMYSMAGTCKLFQEMLNDHEVWRTVSVEKYQWHEDWYGFHEGKIVVKNMWVAAMAGHMESSYIVSLLGLLNPTEGKKDAMEFLCHLSKTKKIVMQACKELIIYPLLRYTILGMPPSSAATGHDTGPDRTALLGMLNPTKGKKELEKPQVFDRFSPALFSVLRPPFPMIKVCNLIYSLTRRCAQTSIWMSFESRTAFTYCANSGFDQKLGDSDPGRLTNGPLRPARNAARVDLVSPRPARIVARIYFVSPRLARM